MVVTLLTDDNNDNPIIIRPHIVFTDERQQWQPNHSVNIICGRIMIGLSLLSSVSKHTMWSYYDWVYCCCRPSVNTICGRINIGFSLLSIVFTDERQQGKPNHNTTTYCVYWRKTKTTTQSYYDHILCLLMDDNNDTMWSYYDYIHFCFRSFLNTICRRIMIGLSLLSSVSKHTMWSYYDWVYCNNKPNHNTTTLYVYWQTTTTTTQS
jgi:hypothetical protein